jgi:ATP synthase protein I
MNKHDNKELAKYLTMVTQLGLIMLVQIFIFFFFGLFLVHKLNLHKSFIILFIFLGMFSGFYFAYKLISKTIEK